MAKIVLYSSDAILSRGLEAVLRQADGLELTSTCTSMPGLQAAIFAQMPDIVLLDLGPDITYGVLSDLKRATPGSKLILWANSISPELAFQAMEMGVRGILRKTLPTDLQVKCLERVLAGDLWFEKGLTEGFLRAKRVNLTRREAQLVALLAQGLKNKEIGGTLNISEGTVKVYLSRLFQKVGVKDRFELALFGLKNLNQVPESGSSPGLRSLIVDRMREPAEAPRRVPKPLWPTVS